MIDRRAPVQLQVIDVSAVAGREDVLAIVEVESGWPLARMAFRSSDRPGLWSVTEIALFEPSDMDPPPHPPRLPVGLIPIEGSVAIGPGLRLIEAIPEAAAMPEAIAAIHPAALLTKGEKR